MNGETFNVQRADYPPNVKWERPKHFDLMVEYAKKLSSDFKFVRVDFYEIQGKIYLGELTFIPGGGYIKYQKDGDLALGKMLDLQ